MSLSVSAGTGNRVSGTLMPLAARNFEPAAAARLDPHPQNGGTDRNDLATDPAVVEVDLLADTGVVEDLGKCASDPRHFVGI